MGEGPKKSVCGADMLHAIRNAYPDCVASEDVLDAADSYYETIRDEVREDEGNCEEES